MQYIISSYMQLIRKESEADVLASAIQILEMKKIFYLRLNSGKILQKSGPVARMITLCPAGTSDLMIIINGQTFFIELKKSAKERMTWERKVERFKATAFVPPSSKREIDQWKFQERARRAGCHAFTLGGIDEFIDCVSKAFRYLNANVRLN